VQLLAKNLPQHLGCHRTVVLRQGRTQNFIHKDSFSWLLQLRAGSHLFANLVQLRNQATMLQECVQAFLRA
jgi:hypothetical protein